MNYHNYTIDNNNNEIFEKSPFQSKMAKKLDFRLIKRSKLLKSFASHMG